MKKLGQTMLEPILLKLPAEELARTVLLEDPLAQGQVPVYDRDITCPAVSLTQHGRVPLTEITAERQFIDLFRIAAYPSLDKIDLKMLRYNALDTAKDRAKDSIIIEEDSRIWTLLDAGITAWEADTVNHTVTTDHSRISCMAKYKRIFVWR
jgi:hypothetical protein